jgi:hypothetical protein
MALRWFCDICGEEVQAPEHPRLLKAYTIGRNRDEQGYGNEVTLIAIDGHARCIAGIAAAIEAAVPASLLHKDTE